MNTDRARNGEVIAAGGGWCAGRVAGIVALAMAVAGCSAFQPPELAPPGTSVGDSNEGWLAEGLLVPDLGDGFRAYRERERRHGSRRLTEVLDETSAPMHERWDDATLWIGDLSARSGGAVVGHHSHRAGRDVDLLFFTVSADGSVERRARFMKFGEDGVAVGGSPPGFTNVTVAAVPTGVRSR